MWPSRFRSERTLEGSSGVARTSRLFWRILCPGTTVPRSARRGRRIRPWALLTTSLGLSHGLVGFAALAQASLLVEVPVTCGSEAAFLVEVAALSGLPVTRIPAAQVRITGDAVRGYELTWVGAGEKRTLRDPDCTTLFRTAIVITAASTSTTATSPVPAQASGAVANPQGAPRIDTQHPFDEGRVAEQSSDQKAYALDAARANPPPRLAPKTLGTFAGGGGGVMLGLTPDATWGAEVLLGFSRAAWSYDLAFRFLPPHSTRTQGVLGLRQWVGGTRVSVGHPLGGWVRVSAGLAAYWIHATGIGVANPQSDQVGMVAPEAEVATTLLQRDDVALEGALQGRFALLQPRFEVEPATTVYQLPRFGLTGLFRVVWGAK